MSASDPPNPKESKRRRVPARQIIRLSARDSRAVIEALLHLAPAGPALRRAAERYRALVHEIDEQRSLCLYLSTATIRALFPQGEAPTE